MKGKRTPVVKPRGLRRRKMTLRILASSGRPGKCMLEKTLFSAMVADDDRGKGKQNKGAEKKSAK